MTARDIAAENLTREAGFYLDSLILDAPATLIPAFSLHDDRAWSVVPVVRMLTKTVGRGAKAHEVVEPGVGMVAVTSDHQLVPYEQGPLAPFHLVPIDQPFIPKPPFKWQTEDVAAYVKNKKTGRRTEDLFEQLTDICSDYVEYSHTVHYKVMALYLLQTYAYTLWPQTGYLHFNGTLQSGKSRSLELIAAVGYNGRHATTMSPASVYRTLNGNPGVLCIDERESFKSEEQQLMYTYLLGGYDRSGKHILTDKTNDTLRPAEYSLYSPKAIASINLIDPTLASRSLIIPMVPALKQPKEMPEDPIFWRQLLNDLHVWALQNALAIRERTRKWNNHGRYENCPDLINRPWQVSRPYIVLADMIDGDLTTEMIAFFNEYFASQRKRMAEVDKAQMLLRVLPRVLATVPATADGFYSAKDIHITMLEFLESDQHDYYKTRHVHAHMTTLQFTERKTIKGGIHYRLTEDQVRDTMRQRGISPFDEDTAWLAGERSYVYTAPLPEPEADVPMVLSLS
jgi:hypothetical protein